MSRGALIYIALAILTVGLQGVALAPVAGVHWAKGAAIAVATASVMLAVALIAI